MKSLSAKLILIFTASVVIPFAVAFWFSISQFDASTKQSVMKANQELAKVAALDVSNYFSHAVGILQGLRAQLEEMNLPLKEQDRILKDVYLDFKFYQYLHITNLSGLVTATSFLEMPDQKIDVRSMMDDMEKDDLYLSSVFITSDPPPVRPAILAALPVRKHGKITGVLVAEINLVYAWHLVHKIQVGREGLVTLVAPDGKIIASSDLALLFALDPYPDFDRVKNSLSLKEPVSFYHQETDHDDIALYAVAPLTGYLQGHIVIKQPGHEIFQSSRALTHHLVILGLCIIMVMSLAGFAGIRKVVLWPLKKLAEATRLIGEGKWGHRVDLKLKDEFGMLGDHFDKMSIKLSDQAQEIKKQERLSFIGRIAGGLVHDLKHPIQNIRNWSRLLSSKHDDETFRNDFEQVIDKEFENVDLFFSNLGELTGNLELRYVAFLVSALLKNIADRFSLAAKENKISLECRNPASDFEIEADRFHVVRVLSNLVSNALQSGASAVVMGAEKETDKVHFYVEDNGRGIAPERLVSLFEDFMTTKRKGLGLGLAISKKIIEAHHGKIAASSEVGKKTRFDVWLPVKKSTYDLQT